MNKFDLKELWHSPIEIKELRNWLNNQINEGNTHLSLEYEYGYYNEIENIDLVVEIPRPEPPKEKIAPKKITILYKQRTLE